MIFDLHFIHHALSICPAVRVGCELTPSNQVNGKTGNSLVEEDDVNIRQYAKYLLKEGSTSDKRELLGNLRSRLNYKDKKITMIAE